MAGKPATPSAPSPAPKDGWGSRDVGPFVHHVLFENGWPIELVKHEKRHAPSCYLEPCRPAEKKE